MYGVYNYCIAGNFCLQADLHENVGVYIRGLPERMQSNDILLTKITVFELNEIFTPRNYPHTYGIYRIIICLIRGHSQIVASFASNIKHLVAILK